MDLTFEEGARQLCLALIPVLAMPCLLPAFVATIQPVPLHHGVLHILSARTSTSSFVGHLIPEMKKVTTISSFPGLLQTHNPPCSHFPSQSPCSRQSESHLHLTVGITQGLSSEFSLKFYFLCFSLCVFGGTSQHRLHEKRFS